MTPARGLNGAQIGRDKIRAAWQRTEIDELAHIISRALGQLLPIHPLGRVHAARRDGGVVEGDLDTWQHSHLGREADDLQQLTYLPRAVAAASDIDEPLPRDGETVSQAVDDGNGFRVVKHDVEGHAIAAALKRRGLLEEVLVASLV